MGVLLCWQLFIHAAETVWSFIASLWMCWQCWREWKLLYALPAGVQVNPTSPISKAIHFFSPAVIVSFFVCNILNYRYFSDDSAWNVMSSRWFVHVFQSMYVFFP